VCIGPVFRTLVHRARLVDDKESIATIVVIAFGALLFLPRLGSLGLWDPWETHYAEVAREMIARHDFVYPYWSNAYFFSKPILTLWLMALGLLVVGAEPGAIGAPLGALTEWGVRLPFAGLAILTLWAVYRIGTFLSGRRRLGLLASFILGTSPQFVLLGKQAITDVPMIAATWAGLAFFLPAVFSEEAGRRPSRPAHRIASAVALVLVVLVELVVIGSSLEHDRWAPAIVLAAAIAVAIFVLRSKDERTAPLAIAAVFFGVAALAKGLEVVALVGPVFVATILIARDRGRFFDAKPLFSLLVFLLVAAPWYLALSSFGGRDEEGLTFVGRFFLHDHFARIASGVHGDRGGAGYYGEQILYGFFPWSAILPLSVAGVVRQMKEKRHAALVFVLIFGLWTWVFLTASQTKLHHYIAPTLPAWALITALFLGSVAKAPRRILAVGAILTMLAVYAIALRDLLDEPRLLVNLVTYKYDRDFPREVIVRPFLAVIFGGGGAFAFIALARKKTALAFRAVVVTAFLSAIWIAHHHFNMLSPHWSQAHLFATYFTDRGENRGEGREPLIAYQLNWRGETFYSRNEVLELMNAGASERLREILKRPGRHFIVLERNRFAELRSLLPPEAKDGLEIVDGSNIHFYLCAVGEG
jgi:4-amino-4-deoxy-L-arabinose transferase-like glycosyltransferase